MPISRGFRRHRPAGTAGAASRLPSGQYEEPGFLVLSAGPTPRVDLATWRLRVDGLVERPREWSWEEIRALPPATFEGDIHCVTKWSKLGVRFSAPTRCSRPPGRFPRPPTCWRPASA